MSFRRTTRGSGSAARAASLRSPVGWALLGLVIERPGYGHEFLQRFERAYGDALELSSASQIYVALDSLVGKGLIKEVAAAETDAAIARQPKPRYQATPEGVAGYKEWLVAQAGEERRRSRLFALQVATLTPVAALNVIESYENACLAQVNQTPRTTGTGPVQTEQDVLAERLASEEDRLSIGARLTWIEYARRELNALVEERDREP